MKTRDSRQIHDRIARPIETRARKRSTVARRVLPVAAAAAMIITGVLLSRTDHSQPFQTPNTQNRGDFRRRADNLRIRILIQGGPGVLQDARLVRVTLDRVNALMPHQGVASVVSPAGGKSSAFAEALVQACQALKPGTVVIVVGNGLNDDVKPNRQERAQRSIAKQADQIARRPRGAVFLLAGLISKPRSHDALASVSRRARANDMVLVRSGAELANSLVRLRIAAQPTVPPAHSPTPAGTPLLSMAILAAGILMLAMQGLLLLRGRRRRGMSQTLPVTIYQPQQMTIRSLSGSNAGKVIHVEPSWLPGLRLVLGAGAEDEKPGGVLPDGSLERAVEMSADSLVGAGRVTIYRHAEDGKTYVMVAGNGKAGPVMVGEEYVRKGGCAPIQDGTAVALGDEVMVHIAISEVRPEVDAWETDDQELFGTETPGTRAEGGDDAFERELGIGFG